MKHFYIKFLITIVITFSSLTGCAADHFCRPSSLRSALDYYGFTTEDQKEALEDLFKQVAIIPQNQSMKENFQRRETDEELITDLLNMVEGAQRNFVIRNGIQERWEVGEQNWMKKNIEKNKASLKTLGFIEPILPQNNRPDAICILGALRGSMANRIHYAESLVHSGLQTKSVILLAGERYVTLDKDGSEEELISIADQFKLNNWKKLTETHLIKELYIKSNLYNRLPFYVIDTQAGALPRPTTQTTMIALSDWLKQNHEVKTMLFISNQPYIHYQSSIIRSVLEKNNINLQFEVVGPAVINRDRIQPILEGLGSYLWASLPEVLSKMKIKEKIHNPEIKNKIKQLYIKNPLVFQTLPEVLKEE